MAIGTLSGILWYPTSLMMEYLFVLPVLCHVVTEIGVAWD